MPCYHAIIYHRRKLVKYVRFVNKKNVYRTGDERTFFNCTNSNSKFVMYSWLNLERCIYVPVYLLCFCCINTCRNYLMLLEHYLGVTLYYDIYRKNPQLLKCSLGVAVLCNNSINFCLISLLL